MTDGRITLPNVPPQRWLLSALLLFLVVHFVNHPKINY